MRLLSRLRAEAERGARGEKPINGALCKGHLLD